MAEWLVENGIAEDRAILLADDGEVLAARIQWPGCVAAGTIEDARLVSRRAGSARGTVRFASGEEALVDHLPATASEGATIRVEVIRSAIAETGRFKRAQARACDAARRPARSLAQALQADGHAVRIVRRFPDDPWPEIVAEAQDGIVPFPGGNLVVTPTPAMTLIDIDGFGSPAALTLAAIPAIRRAIRQFDIGGSIGIDFPTLERKDDRKAADTALEQALADWPHQRTAMNGFGFVQLVARLQRPSLLQHVRTQPAAAAARLLLRRAEAIAEPGLLLLTAHPAVIAATLPEWIDELARRSGRQLRWQEDRGLALHGGFAQALSA